MSYQIVVNIEYKPNTAGLQEVNIQTACQLLQMDVVEYTNKYGWMKRDEQIEQVMHDIMDMYHEDSEIMQQYDFVLTKKEIEYAIIAQPFDLCISHFNIYEDKTNRGTNADIIISSDQQNIADHIPVITIDNPEKFEMQMCNMIIDVLKANYKDKCFNPFKLKKHNRLKRIQKHCISAIQDGRMQIINNIQIQANMTKHTKNAKMQ